MTMPPSSTASADPTARIGSAVEDHLAGLTPEEFGALVGRTRPPDESTKPPTDKPSTTTTRPRQRTVAEGRQAFAAHQAARSGQQPR